MAIKIKFFRSISFWVVLSALTVFFSCKKEPKTDNQPKAPIEESRVVPQVYEPKLPTKSIEVDGNRLLVEVADEPDERQNGLMFRYYLPDTVGMLFIFDDVKPHPFWMKNTFIPLDIAFIDEKLTITDIKWMEPHDETSHYPSRAIKYALETSRGWFLKHNIKPGAKLKL